MLGIADGPSFEIGKMQFHSLLPKGYCDGRFVNRAYVS
jgi:hypothetical protein